MRHCIHDLVAVLVFGLLMVNGWGCAGDGRLEIDAPGCDLTVSFDEQTTEPGRAALTRINQATGCALAEELSGVPVQAVDVMRALDGRAICGGTVSKVYADGTLRSVDSVNVSVALGQCPDVETTLVHELFHAMVGPGIHAEGGVFHAKGGNGLINEATLETVCAHIECPAFVPEG